MADEYGLCLLPLVISYSSIRTPPVLTKLSYLIDNPWSNALDRARQAGAVLADILINRRLGVRPVSLIGFSLGARVIFFALIELAKANAFGVVQEVYLFGATVTASKKVWRQVRGIVAGRFVNAFAMNDWVLGYLFRATSGGLQTVAGLRPIDHVPDLENVDITDILVGHMSYRTLMPTLLAYVGFKVTADHFDEPEEMEMEADREVLTAEEEERRRAKKEKSKLSSFFRKKKANSDSGSASMSRNASGEYDLPPRMSTGSASSLPLPDDPASTSSIGLGINGHRARSASTLSVASSAPSEADSEDIAGPPPVVKVHVEPASPPTPTSPSTGFDLTKLRQEVAQRPRSNPTTPTSDLPPVLPTVGAVPSGVVATDLTNLDTTLDPQDLLRRQWSDATVDAWAPSVAVPGGTSRSASPAPTLRSQPSFTFGDADGKIEAPLQYTFGNGESGWGDPGANAFGAGVGDGEDPPPTFVWGKAGASTASLRSQNPW